MDIEAATAPTSLGRAHTGGADQARHLRVLQVDDEPLHLRVVEDILSAFGHSTTSARSGREALERLAQEEFDLVLMDVHMPSMSGVEVVRRLRASRGPERTTPVIALTADVLTRTADEYRDLGFNAFLAKPILVDGLMSSVMAAVGEPYAGLGHLPRAT